MIHENYTHVDIQTNLDFSLSEIYWPQVHSAIGSQNVIWRLLMILTL